MNLPPPPPPKKKTKKTPYIDEIMVGLDLVILELLALLSRRLIGELIVYQCLRRPSTFSNIFSSETTELIFHMETP